MALSALGSLCALLLSAAPAGAVGFLPAANYNAGGGGVALTVGDFNADSDPDLTLAHGQGDTANNFMGHVPVLVGGAGGSFAAQPNLLAGGAPSSVAVGDFNADSDSDLAVTNGDSNNVSVLLGGAGASFGAATNFAVGNGPIAVVVGDFNADSDPDLAVGNAGNSGTGGNNVSVLLGAAGGSFGAATNFAVGGQPRSVAVGDFNGDSDLDLAVSSQGSQHVSVLLNSPCHDPAAIKGTNGDNPNLTGTEGADIICGLGGNDTINGLGGGDLIVGGNGNDTLDGGAGPDELQGNAGTDRVTYATRTAGVVVDLQGGASDGEPGEGDTVLNDVEKATGGSGGDTISGSSLVNDLNGSGGADSLDGMGDNDTLDGAAGNDTLDGGTGADVITGNAGRDTVTYAARTAGVVVDLQGGASDGEPGEGDTVLNDVENAIGGSGADSLTGYGFVPGNALGLNRLEGGNGNDTINGLGGLDSLYGGGGDDLLRGENGNGGSIPGCEPTCADVNSDGLYGGAGNDTLRGDSGADTLAGGPDMDTLDGGVKADQLNGGGGADTVTYVNRTEAVTATLDGTFTSGGALDGPSGSRDIITLVESLVGGAGADELRGNDAANTLTGRTGADTLIGLNGNDTLNARDLGADSLLDCGAGAADTLLIDAEGDPGSTGCETILPGPA